MLVQARSAGLRLITQHDHALLAGRLASAWRDAPVGPVPSATVLAIALHDVVWVPEDRRPRLDPDSGRPHDFTTLPRDRRTELVARGLARLRALAPELARPVEAHHRALSLGLPEEPDAELTHLRFFDLLSLRLCLTGPDARGATPPWLTRGRRVGPDGLLLPELTWIGEGRALLDPFPFPAPLGLRLPYRELTGAPYRNQDELDVAWTEATPETWTLRLSPPLA